MRKLLGLLIIIILIVMVLVWLGWIKINTQGEFRTPAITATGGEVPSVDIDTKEVRVGTRNATVDVPTVGTEEKSVQVPTVTVTDGGNEAQ